MPRAVAGLQKGVCVQLERTDAKAIAEMRAEKLRTFHVPLLPSFHVHLAHHADTFAVRDGASTVGYALLLFDKHEGHDHVTLIEGYLTPPYRDRYEDMLDLISEELAPRAYLVRSDDCTFETALIAEGFSMEVSMSVLVARATFPPQKLEGLALVPMDYPHLRAAHDLVLHARGVQQAPTYSELEQEIENDSHWVVTDHDQAIGLVIRERSQGERYCLLDVLAPHVGDEVLVWAVQTAGQMVAGDDVTPAAVVDARDARKLQVFRQAGYYTAASYLIFYDQTAGRPSVPVISREQLWELMQSGTEFHLVDVLGEDHWGRGHLPGAEWIDFRSLTREARKRYRKDEKIIVYCNDFT